VWLLSYGSESLHLAFILTGSKLFGDWAMTEYTDGSDGNEQHT
jgi:hypothetical protein